MEYTPNPTMPSPAQDIEHTESKDSVAQAAERLAEGARLYLAKPEQFAQLALDYAAAKVSEESLKAALDQITRTYTGVENDLPFGTFAEIGLVDPASAFQAFCEEAGVQKPRFLQSTLTH